MAKPPVSKWKTGDAVRITSQGRTFPGMVKHASPNGLLLVLEFDGALAGHVGTMPVRLGSHLVWRSTVNKAEVVLKPLPPHSRR
ncbi:MAG: hypothetical protein ACRYG8_29225 [Janthinobacterium lividum]